MSNFYRYYKPKGVEFPPTYRASFIDHGSHYEVAHFYKLGSSTQRAFSVMEEDKFLQWIKDNEFVEIEFKEE